jgi:hypothetical protein
VGNLSNKSDVGSYGYDANGNVAIRNDATFRWASFDLPKRFATNRP